MLYFDNISELANITSQLFVQDDISINEASHSTTVLTLSRNKPFYGVGCLKKNEMHTDLPNFRNVPRISYTIKDVSISEISFGKFWILRRFNVNQMPFFQLVSRGVCFSPRKKNFQQYCILSLSGNFRIFQRKHGAV